MTSRIPVTAPASSGATSIFINSGIVNRQGIELSLVGDVVKSQDFNWTTSIKLC